MKVQFEFLGLRVEVESASGGPVDEVRRDFSFFLVPGSDHRASLRVELHETPPPYEGLPAIPAAFVTPRNTCFRHEDIQYVDYFGRGLAVYDRKGGRCVLYAVDRDLLHEMAYLFILSTVGQWLDSRGIHRLHALGVSHRGRGILLLLPSGGGKSTTALRLLREPGFQLLSEDTPLIDRRGWVLPFPLRLGVRPEQDTGVPPQYLRTVRRMEFDPKTLVDIEYFGDRLGCTTRPTILLIGRRNLGDVAEIVPVGRMPAFRALVANMIVGLGVYQGLEFLLERGMWELSGRLGVAASRTYNSVALLRQTRAYRFVMGRDLDRNIRTLVTFLSEPGRDGCGP